MSKKPNPKPAQRAFIGEAAEGPDTAGRSHALATGPGGSTEQKPANPGDVNK